MVFRLTDFWNPRWVTSKTSFSVLLCWMGMLLEDTRVLAQRIYVADTEKNRIVSSAPFTKVLQYGKKGSGRGRFNKPTSVAVDAWSSRMDTHYRIYVADSGNNRLCRLRNLKGKEWKTLGTRGVGEKQFDNPTWVCISHRGKIYVADTGNHRIVRMDNMDGDGWTTYGTRGSGPGQFDSPGSITVDSQEHLYIADTGNQRLVRIDTMQGANWQSLNQITFPGSPTIFQFSPRLSVSLDAADGLYVRDLSDTGSEWRCKISGMDGRGITGDHFSLGSSSRDRNIPRSNFAFDQSGRLYYVAYPDGVLVSEPFWGKSMLWYLNTDNEFRVPELLRFPGARGICVLDYP